MKLTYVLNDTFFIPELHGLLILNVKKYFNILKPINTLYIVQVYANWGSVGNVFETTKLTNRLGLWCLMPL